MEIHKPKPWHSLREFLKEYAIIVLGVITALAAEQTVERLHWQHRVHDAMEAIQYELRDDNGPQAYTRAAAETCFDRQLDGIQAAIESGRSRAEIIALARRYVPPRVTWDSAAWEAMLGSGVASHIPSGQMIRLGLLYSAMPVARSMATEEAADLVVLRPVRQSGDALSPGEADTVLAALARLRDTNHRFGRGGRGFLANMADSGVVLTDQEKNRILRDLRALYPDCVTVPVVRHLDPGDQLTDTRRAMGPAVQH